MSKIPRKEGHYWGKWRIKSDDAAEPNEPPSGEWEVIHVVENCIDESDPEHLMAMVPGERAWQPLENFFWGDGPLKVPGHR